MRLTPIIRMFVPVLLLRFAGAARSTVTSTAAAMCTPLRTCTGESGYSKRVSNQTLPYGTAPLYTSYRTSFMFSGSVYGARVLTKTIYMLAFFSTAVIDVILVIRFKSLFLIGLAF
jgi:hypothetical protein